MKDRFVLVVVIAIIQAIFLGIYIISDKPIEVSEVSFNKAANACSGGFVNMKPYRAMSNGLFIETLCKNGEKIRVRIK
jgi:predicted small secreted protein